MALSQYEQEVSITFNAAEDTADLYTSYPVWISKMDKLCEEHPESFQLLTADLEEGGRHRVVAKIYRFPKDLITIKSKKRTMSDEQRAKNVERLRAAREKSKSE